MAKELAQQKKAPTEIARLELMKIPPKAGFALFHPEFFTTGVPAKQMITIDPFHQPALHHHQRGNSIEPAIAASNVYRGEHRRQTDFRQGHG
jgi:hypothetical protein